jgi:protein-tyrosine phosphatase
MTAAIVVVCHANVCRSPMAAALLGARLSAIGVDATVSSAGLLRPGQPAAAHGIAVMRARGLDLNAHRSAQISPALVAGADVVLTMEREQLREVVLASPPSFPHCYTLKEIVRRGEDVGPREREEPMEEWLARVHAGRQTSMLLGRDAHDDVEDPMGGTRADFERTALELDELVDRFVALAFAKNS